MIGSHLFFSITFLWKDYFKSSLYFLWYFKVTSLGKFQCGIKQVYPAFPLVAFSNTRNSTQLVFITEALKEDKIPKTKIIRPPIYVELDDLRSIFTHTASFDTQIHLVRWLPPIPRMRKLRPREVDRVTDSLREGALTLRLPWLWLHFSHYGLALLHQEDKLCKKILDRLI